MKMETLVCLEPGKFEYRKSDFPVLQKGEAIVKVRKVGICGTDLHAFEGTQPYFEYPRILGHELAVEFVEGDTTQFTKGERLTVLPYFNCGSCYACRSGKPNCCEHLKVCGVHQDGGMVEYLKVQSRFLVKGDGLSEDELALVEPLSIGAHALSRANLQADEFVLVVGAGPIGLGIMEMARVAGGKIIALDVQPGRLEFCRNSLGVIHCLNATDPVLMEKLKDITAGDMPAIVIDATGSLNAINNAFRFMAHGGRYVLVGLQKNDITFSHPQFHKREGTLMSSRNATMDDFGNVISALQHKLIRAEKFITHRVSFGDLGKKFSTYLDPAVGVIKAIVEF
jgi:2-desacetyl-2-hydroxyethyl bacteriochlorophyllide A dehydrogenase